jgi:GDP-4-dehydro-6-deoxy-D-mannose reductase
MSDGPTLLLLGASGFLGGHLHEAALGSGFRVLTAGRRPGELPACDLLDPAALEACVAAAAPDLIVNAAGDSSVARSWEQPAASFAVNATGVRNLLAASARTAPAAHLTCLSSAAVYGEPAPGEMPLAEAARRAPVSPYGEAKQAMEAFCAESARAAGLAVAVVRAFNLVGPGQPSFSAASGLARQIAAAERDGEAEIELAVGNPAAARDSTDVRDGARSILELARRRLEGTYNLCSGSAPSVAELAAALAELTPLRVSTRIDPGLARPSDPPLLLGDPRKLQAAIELAPSTPLATSLADTLAWWRAELGSAPVR